MTLGPRQRLLLLSAWRESELYTERERAALAWAKSLTRIAESHAPDGAYEEVRSVFSDDEREELEGRLRDLGYIN